MKNYPDTLVLGFFSFPIGVFLVKYEKNMEAQGKKINIYRGIWISFIAMISFPTGAFFLLYAIIDRYFDYPQIVTINYCLALAGAIGFFFCLICLLTGFIKDLFAALIDRIRETREFYDRIFSKEGLKWYFLRFKEDGGIIIWIFFLITLIFLGISIYGFVTTFTYFEYPY